MTTAIRSIDTHLVEKRRNRIRNPQGTSVPSAAGIALAPQWFGQGGTGSTTPAVAGANLPEGVSTFMRKTWTTAPSSWSSIAYQFYSGTRAPVTAGEKVYVRYWWRSSVALTLTTNSIALQVFNAVSVGSSIGYVSTPHIPAPAANTWQLVEGEFVVPATGFMTLTHVVVAAAGAANGMTLDGTAALVSSVGPYFDGSTAPSGDRSHTWAGAAGASESIEWLRVPVVDVRPMLLDGYEAKRELGTLVHPILGRPDPDVTMRPAGLRAGVLRLVMPDAESAHAAVDALLQPHVFELVPATVTQMGMRFVVAGDEATTELDKTTRVRWIVQVPYREVHA